MAIISNSTVQYKYLGNGFLDSKLDPYNTLSDLIKAYPRKYRKEGLFGVVLNTDKTTPDEKFPQVYVYYGGEWNPMDRIISEKVATVIQTSNQNKDDLDKIKTQIATIISGLDGKADKSTVEALVTEVSDKASKEEVQSLSDIIAKKAAQSEVDNLSQAISKIAGIEKLKPGEGILLSPNNDGTTTISAPSVAEFDLRLDTFETTLNGMKDDVNQVNGFNERITKIENGFTNVQNGFEETKSTVSKITANDEKQDQTITELKTKVDSFQPSGLDVAGDDGDEIPTL